MIEKSYSWQPSANDQLPPGNRFSADERLLSDELYVIKYGGLPPSLATACPDVVKCVPGIWDDQPQNKMLTCPGCNSYRDKFNQIAYDKGLTAAQRRLASAKD